MTDRFDKMLKFVLDREGGYSNNPNDKGGETNKGITFQTYNNYRKSKGLPIQSVKYITDKEVKEIYYNNYYKASGADKIRDARLSAYVFDTAVNMGVSRAKTFLKESNGDIKKYDELRRNKYREFVAYNPSQQQFLQGWNNRLNSLSSFVQSELSGNNTLQNYSGNSLLLHGYINTTYDPMTSTFVDSTKRFSIEDIENMTQEEFNDNEEEIMQQVQNGLILPSAINYLDYSNPLSGDNKIFSREDIANMSLEEYAKFEKEINAQLKSIGIPSNLELQELSNSGNLIYVNGYMRSDGTLVKGYYRSK